MHADPKRACQPRDCSIQEVQPTSPMHRPPGPAAGARTPAVVDEW